MPAEHDDVHATLQRCLALLDVGRPREAVAMLHALLAVEPDDPRGHALLAQAHLALEEPQPALAAANRAVALDPDGEWGHRLCALALDRLGQPAEADRAAREAVRLRPNAWETHVVLAQVNSARPGHRELAEQAAREAVRLAPNEPDAHFTLGLVAQRNRHPDVAREAYGRTLALDPEHATAVNNLTVLGTRFRPGSRLVPTAHGYATALRLDPQSTVVRRNLDALVARFARRLYWLGLGAYFVALAVVSLGTGGAEGTGGADAPSHPTTLSVGFAVLMAVGLLAYLVSLGRAVPLGVRRHALTLLLRPTLTAARAGLALALVVMAWVSCLVPDGAAVAGAALTPIVLANVALLLGSRFTR